MPRRKLPDSPVSNAAGRARGSRTPMRQTRARWASAQGSQPTASNAAKSLRFTRGSLPLVVELRMPVRAASLGRKVEHVPDRPDEIGVARVLAGIAFRVEQLTAPAMMHPAVLAEYVQHRHLRAV